MNVVNVGSKTYCVATPEKEKELTAQQMPDSICPQCNVAHELNVAAELKPEPKKVTPKEPPKKEIKKFKAGDKSRAICPFCKVSVPITFKCVQPPFRIKGKDIPEVLQGFCDECGRPAIIPHQSSATIKELMAKKEK